jgi:hypothetical protein
LPTALANLIHDFVGRGDALLLTGVAHTEVVDDYAGASSGKRERVRTTNTATGAGDDRHASGAVLLFLSHFPISGSELAQARAQTP